MLIKALVDEDFVNFKQASMFIGFPNCTFKCPGGKKMCQNSSLSTSKSIEVDIKDLVERFLKNPITSAVVCGGLEPFDNFKELLKFCVQLRLRDEISPIVIYTGYNRDEIKSQIEALALLPNIIVKFGRYLPNERSHYDGVLGVNLASNNQYAEVIS